MALTESRSFGRRISGRIDRLSDSRYALLSFIPGGVLIFLFVIPPIVAVIVMSFMRIELLRDGLQGFNGLANYTTRLPGDEEFWAAVPRTVALAGGVVAITVPLALLCALLMNRRSRFSWLIGLAVLMPWAVAPVVTGLYWKFIFNSEFGLATAAVNAVGLANGPVGWLSSPTSAMVIAVIATAWRMIPLMALLILGALKAIPDSLYRAARMDGAGAFSAFRLITLPAIAPTLIIVGVTSVVFSLQSIDILFTLTGGGPGRSTTVVTWYLYQNAIGQLSFGYSATLAIVLLVVIALCSSLIFITRIRRRRRAFVPVTESSSADAELGAIELGAIQAVAFHPGAVAAVPPNGAGVEHGQGSADPEPASDVVEDRIEGATFGGPAVDGAVHGAASPAAAPNWRSDVPRRRFRLPAWVGRLAIVVGATLLLTWLVGPVIWIAIASLQPEASVSTLPLTLSGDLRFDNYVDLLTQPAWQQALFVSVQLVLFTTVLTIAICALAAYPLARYRVPGSRFIIGGLIATQMVPAIVLIIPVLLTFRFIGLKDTVAALVIVNVAFWIPSIVWLLRNFFMDVPRSLESAARMDGASRLGSLFRVVLPAARPGLLATSILIIIGTWNEFLFAVILGDRRAVTVTRVIGFIGQSAAGPDGPPPVTVIAAAGILAFLPCLLLVVFFYRRLVAGLSTGQLKA